MEKQYCHSTKTGKGHSSQSMQIQSANKQCGKQAFLVKEMSHLTSKNFKSTSNPQCSLVAGRGWESQLSGSI